MVETIKEVYENVTKIFNHISNNFIGQCLNRQLIQQLKYTIDSALFQAYPYYKFTSKIDFNEYTHELKIDVKPDILTFPKISYKNYHSHNFIIIEKKDTFFLFPTMKCKDCDLSITEDGNIIDGDFSCAEWSIKNILE